MFFMIIGGVVVGFFVNGMFVGYGVMIICFYLYYICLIVNNFILNVGCVIGGFLFVIIGMILDVLNVFMVMFFLVSFYIVSFLLMLSIK